MSWCVSHWTIKSISFRYAMVSLGFVLAMFALATPAKAQFSDTSSTSEPSQSPQEQTSNVQTDEVRCVDRVGFTLMPEQQEKGAIAQFVPTSDPSDPNISLPQIGVLTLLTTFI